jgi:Mn2+/Fe2+ NRAMP family transporter
MQVFLQYRQYVATLKWLTLALFAYFAAVITTHIDWRELASCLFLPTVRWEKDYFMIVVAVFGTTISPYLFFWQSMEEAEDIRAHPRRRELIDAPAQGKAALHRIRIDTLIGMALANLVALAIMVMTAATLNAKGITDIQTSAQAAEALRPVVGRFAFIVFALGVVGTGLLSVPVLAGSVTYAIGEARGWPGGFSRQPMQAATGLRCAADRRSHRRCSLTDRSAAIRPDGCRDKGREQRPFGIIEIAGVETGIHGRGSRVVKQPASPAAAQHQAYVESNTCIEQ